MLLSSAHRLIARTQISVAQNDKSLRIVRTRVKKDIKTCSHEAAA